MAAPALVVADDVEAAARHFLQRIDRPGRLLVAISGGSDSTALLQALHKVLDAAAHPIQLVAATVDHGLRPEAAGEAVAAARLAESLGIPHRTLHWQDAKPESALQEAARLARYRLLREAGSAMEAMAVVTGHTLDDQVETVAMRAARAEGVQGHGLAGMAEATLFAGDCWILRPLLSVKREALRAYLTRNRIGWIDDPSNDNPAFERVRVRKEGAAGDPDAIGRAGGLRTERAARIAEVIATGAESWSGALFALPRRSGEDGFLGAVLELAALAGGADHLPGGRQREELAAFLAAPDDGRHSLSRSVIEKRRAHVFVNREHRSLPAMTLGPGEIAVWDRRFTLRNRGTQPLDVCPGRREPLKSDEAWPPPALLASALATLPHVLREEVGTPVPAREVEDLEIVPRIARHDTFLPGFDRIMANALTALIGRPAYGAPPLRSP